MESYLREFADMSEKAQELLPTLDAKIRELTENFSESVRQSIRANQESIHKQNEFAQTVISGFSNLDKRASDAIDKVEESSGRLNSQMADTFKNAEQRMKIIDEELEKGLTNALNGFGGKLASISDRFAMDYGRLADKLKDVLEIIQRQDDHARR